jgi:hypothetical protein
MSVHPTPEAADKTVIWLRRYWSLVGDFGETGRMPNEVRADRITEVSRMLSLRTVTLNNRRYEIIIAYCAWQIKVGSQIFISLFTYYFDVLEALVHLTDSRCSGAKAIFYCVSLRLQVFNGARFQILPLCMKEYTWTKVRQTRSVSLPRYSKTQNCYASDDFACCPARSRSSSSPANV